MEKHTGIIIIVSLFILLASFTTANNASMNVTGSPVSPTLISSCNISGIPKGFFQYTLYQDGINISYGQFNSNATTHTSMTSFNAESGYTETGSWEVGDDPADTVDENFGTEARCRNANHCYITEWRNFSYIDVYTINWIYTCLLYTSPSPRDRS